MDEMFEKLKFANVDEESDFKKQVVIRGRFLFKQIYDYLIWLDKTSVPYSDLNTCIRYDKHLRDKLYIYLATFEEYLRAQIFDKYDIESGFRWNREDDNFITQMAKNMFECKDVKSSVLYKKFGLDLGETIALVKELNMFDKQRYNEFEKIRILRNRVMHHNLLVLGKAKSLKESEENKNKIKEAIVALADNLPDGYKINFIKAINDLICNCANYKIKIEA